MAKTMQSETVNQIKAKFKELHELLQLKEDAIVQDQSSQAE